MSKARPSGPVGIAVLGSTGSVGQQTLDVIDAHPDRFRVVSLVARAESDRFLAQIARYAPDVAAVSEGISRSEVGSSTILTGANGLIEASTHPSVAIVVVASSGHAAIVPTIHAVESGKIIALANKETLICAGEIIVPLAAARGIPIRPVDSEHSAIWQALGGSPIDQVQRIILTASGGPFRTASRSDLARISAEDALAHPTWSMGAKISVDSATLMNKGLEVIEAHWLFGLPYNQIEVLVHPESVVHSLVEFVDGGLIAQLGLPDMRLPIQYALTYPDRIPLSSQRLELVQIGALHFERPDEEKFPALRLAREAGIAGRTFPTVLSTADEEAVGAFLAGSLRFNDIAAVVETVMEKHQATEVTLESILEADAWTRRAAASAISERRSRL